jgi:hypothetical protein
MVAKLRWMLICLIVLAMPVQGIAAATMRFCGPGGAAQHHAAAAHHHGDAQDAAAASDHQHHASPADAANDAAGGLDAMSKMKCSVCAACCMATAIAPDVPALHTVEAASKVVLPARISYVGPVADGLERPPRPSLA